MPFGNGEKKRIFCFFSFRYRHGFASARGTVVLSRETRPCLSVSDRKTKHIFCFFPSARGTVLLPQEARLCLREKYVCTSWKRKRKYVFLPLEAWFWFRERHGTHPILFLDRKGRKEKKARYGTLVMQASLAAKILYTCMHAIWLAGVRGRPKILRVCIQNSKGSFLKA